MDLERAGAAAGKELTSGGADRVSGRIDLDDPEAVLAMLAAYDPHAVYADGPEGELLSANQLGRLVDAISEFVAQLA